MRRLLCALAMLWTPAAPALADVVEIDLGPVLECVEAAGDDSIGLRSCQGEVARACMTEEGGETTHGMVMCYGAEAEAWTRIMDNALARLSESNTGLAPSLQVTQDAWLVYRESECSYRVERWGLGSGARVALASCVAQLTADRAITLKLYEPEAD